MNFVGDARKKSIFAVLQDQKEIFFGLLVIEIDRELIE